MSFFGELAKIFVGWLVERVGLYETPEKESVKITQNSNTGGIQAGQINAPVTQYNIQRSNDILSEYEARNKEFVEKGKRDPQKLEWSRIKSGSTREISFLNEVAPALVVHAYRSEAFKREFHGPELISYLIETVQNGYMKRMINGKYLPAAFTEGIWPYYLLTVQAKTGSLVEIDPPKVVDMMNEAKKNDSMVAVEHMFQEVKKKAGDPFDLRAI